MHVHILNNQKGGAQLKESLAIVLGPKNAFKLFLKLLAPICFAEYLPIVFADLVPLFELTFSVFLDHVCLEFFIFERSHFYFVILRDVFPLRKFSSNFVLGNYL